MSLLLYTIHKFLLRNIYFILQPGSPLFFSIRIHVQFNRTCSRTIFRWKGSTIELGSHYITREPCPIESSQDMWFRYANHFFFYFRWGNKKNSMAVTTLLACPMSLSDTVSVVLQQYSPESIHVHDCVG